MKYMAPLGRFLFAGIFVMAGPMHFKAGEIAAAAGAGVPLPAVLVPLSGIIAMIGGFSVVLGYKAKWGAWLLVLFLAPVTVVMHRFWGLPDPGMAMIQMAMFMKNVSMLGAALLVTQVGSGPLSLKD